ncbi:sulfotransferase domain-containing protein [Actinomadura rugatobispora]|uniref:Sulfotransferase domain-containing protein n=1 Tax=Actinomadura rugatobispora TaxID=1994 RepID=A0ABW1AHR6_9ACTN|nr:glycolipid sulfotransferase [Actinomadura rugatobispora]
MRKPAMVYRTPEDDSTRWLGFPFRPGDIVVSTAHKSGTTWTQMICALLVFQTPELPAPLAELSPWLDQLVTPADEVYASLAAQEHRRFIKTHTPLDGLPLAPEVTYIVVARHPLDVAVSRYHHFEGLPAGERPRIPPVREWVLSWVDRDDWQPDSLQRLVWHLSDAWERRDEPNVVLVHYEDLSLDLDHEMRRLAGRLGISVPDRTWPALVEAATFKHMRARADLLVPKAAKALTDNRAFFRKGTSGSGRALLAGEELAHYRERVETMASPDLLSWLHRPCSI